MKTPPPRQAQLEFVERAGSRYSSAVFRVNSNARSAPQRTARGFCWLSMVYPGRAAQRTPPPPARGHSQRHHQKQPRMNSNAKNALIVIEKLRSKKSRVTHGSRTHRDY